MARKLMAAFICLAMMVCALGAAAEGTPVEDAQISPELMAIGGLGASAIAAAVQRGEQVKYTATMNIDGLEALGEEDSLLMQAVLGSILLTGKVQQGSDSGMTSYSITAKGEEVAAIDILFFDRSIDDQSDPPEGDAMVYVSSNLLGEDTYSLSIREALDYLSDSSAPALDDERLARRAALAERLSDPAVLEPYKETMSEWFSANMQTVKQELSAEEAAELAHPEAVRRETLEVTGIALQTLALDMLNVLAADENMLDIMVQIAIDGGVVSTADELKAAIAQMQGMAGAILGGMLTSVTATALFDADEKVVFFEITGGMIVSEEQIATASFMYDQTVVDGTAYVASTFTLDGGADASVRAYVSNVAEPIVEIGDAMTQNLKTTVGVDIEKGGETGTARIVVVKNYNTGSTREVITTNMDIGVEGVLADFIASEGVPFTGFNKLTVETTEVTETGFTTTIDQTLDYTGVFGEPSSVPVVYQTLTMTNVPSEELTEPADAINVLTMTAEQVDALKLEVEARIESIVVKLAGMYPELAEHNGGIDSEAVEGESAPEAAE
ncbi:MAG: hypothetical protein LBH66_05470 [Oscillospiraceae bacterium]|jgi:hypothetical protein|nr:hypothetical protein [Oscillospiraceae bacterium]